MAVGPEVEAALRSAFRQTDQSPSRTTGSHGSADHCWPQWELELLHQDEALLIQIADAEAASTRLAVEQARDMQALRDLRLADQSAYPAGHDEQGWVATEIGVALGLSETQVRRRLEWVDGLDRYPHVAALACEGGAPVWILQRLIEHLDELAALMTADEFAEVEPSVVDWLSSGSRTVAQLNRRMRRLILRARADAGLDDDAAIARRHAERDVRVRSNGDGTAHLSALLPEADALAVAAALQVAAADQRTMAQRRADVLVASVLGRPGLYGMPADVPAHAGTGPAAEAGARIDVTIPVRSLTGASSAPGEVGGYGVVPSVTARDLAGTPGATFRGLLFDADTGMLVGVAPDLGRVHWVHESRPGAGYQHPPVMERLVRARDRRCRAPGCQRAAARCDCDHVEPWPTGATTLSNTCCLCRYHHRMKTHATGWSTQVDDDGGLTWTTPTGATVTTAPYDYRDDDPPPF